MQSERLLNCEKERFSGVYFSALAVLMLVANLVFSVFLASSGRSEELIKTPWVTFLSFSVSGIVIICITAFFSYTKKIPIVEICGWKRVEPKYYLIAVLTFLAVFFGLGNLNSAFISFLEKSVGYKSNAVELPPLSVPNYLMVTLTVCILPAVTEEVAMRGVIQSGVKSGNLIINALIGGFIFSIYHMNPSQTPYQFAFGFVLSIIAIKSRSTLATTIAHFLNNFAIINIEYFCKSAFNFQGVWLAVAIVLGLSLLVGIVYYLLKKEKTEDLEKGSLKAFFISAIPGLIVCLLMWIANLFA